MSNVVTWNQFVDKIMEKNKTKNKNTDIIQSLYHDGKLKFNPRVRPKQYKDSVVEVPKSCFVAGQAYKVGV